MPKAIIFANGVPHNLQSNRRYLTGAEMIICADGGTLHALALGVQPDLIVGDLDSLPVNTRRKMEAEGVPIEQYPTAKDQTDLELALLAAMKRGASEIIILTALGGRLDQLLANVLLLTRPEWGTARLSIAEGPQQAWLLRVRDQLKIKGAVDDTLSIVGLSEQLEGLCLNGVIWPLENVAVPLGSTLTISNRLITPEATVTLQKGLALVIHIRLAIDD